MSNWYEVFDNEEVQCRARRQAARLSAVAAAAVLLTLALAALMLEGLLPYPVAGSLLLVVWLVAVRWTTSRMRKLRRIVWCIKLSQERVVGYDYTRHKAILEWHQVRRVELAGDGLLLVGPEACTFEVPHLFPDFAELSHRVVRYAEANAIPVFIDGQPWEALDVYEFFPFLTPDHSADAPGAAAT